MTFGELINGLERNLGVELVDEGGATLAVDPGNGHLFLQKYNWLDRLDAEKALTNLTRFVDTVQAWRGIVAEGVPQSAIRLYRRRHLTGSCRCSHHHVRHVRRTLKCGDGQGI